MDGFGTHELDAEDLVRGRKPAVCLHLGGYVASSGVKELKQLFAIVAGVGFGIWCILAFSKELRGAAKHKTVEDAPALASSLCLLLRSFMRILIFTFDQLLSPNWYGSISCLLDMKKPLELVLDPARDCMAVVSGSGC